MIRNGNIQDAVVLLDLPKGVDPYGDHPYAVENRIRRRQADYAARTFGGGVLRATGGDRAVPAFVVAESPRPRRTHPSGTGIGADGRPYYYYDSVVVDGLARSAQVVPVPGPARAYSGTTDARRP